MTSVLDEKVGGYSMKVWIPVVAGGVVVGFLIMRATKGSGGSDAPVAPPTEIRLPPIADGIKAPAPPVPEPPKVKGPAPFFPPGPPTIGQPPHYTPPVKAPPMPIGGVRKPAPIVPPAPAPPRASVSYPGLPPGYQMDCTHAAQALLGSWDTILAGQRSKRLDNTFLARLMATIAITGATTPLRFNAASAANPPSRPAVNLTRVAWGLHPLTDVEFEQMAGYAIQMMPRFSERDANFQNLSYAKMLFDKFNAPYQCARQPIK